MAEVWKDGEVKVRPGAYFQVKNGDPIKIAAINGIVACCFKSDWGPLGQVVEIDAGLGYVETFGDAGTTDLMKYAIEGGATGIYAYRLGSGGSVATITLKNSENADAVKITARCPGSRAFTVAVQDMLADPTLREIIFYNGTTEYAKVIIEKGGDECAALIAALSENASFKGTLVDAKAAGELAAVAEAPMTAGTDPTYSNGDYDTALKALEPYWANVTLVDTEDTDVQLLLRAHNETMFKYGILTQSVVAEKMTTEQSNRIKHAEGFNTEQMVFLLNGRVSHRKETTLGSSKIIDGYQSAALIGGYIAGVLSNVSLTHQVIEQLNELIEPMSPAELTYAERHGCLCLSYDPDSNVWIDNAINTLVKTPDDRDAGWKKIRRVKTRYEMMYRMNTTADKLVGKVDNDENGRKTIIAALQGVGDDMVNDEKKLNKVVVTESKKYKSDGDSCWFDIDVVDKDSAEHIYLTYYFHFSTNVESAA